MTLRCSHAWPAAREWLSDRLSPSDLPADAFALTMPFFAGAGFRVFDCKRTATKILTIAFLFVTTAPIAPQLHELGLGLDAQLPPGRNALGKQRENEMLFCPTCANCLIIQLDDQGNNKWSCHTCPYEFPIVRQMTTRLHLKRKEVDDVMGGEESWKNVDSTDGKPPHPSPSSFFPWLWEDADALRLGWVVAPCPKCENPKAFFMQLQIRSADEPSKLRTTMAKKEAGELTIVGVLK